MKRKNTTINVNILMFIVLVVSFFSIVIKLSMISLQEETDGINLTQFNKNNQNDLYINCLKKAEQERQEKLILLESGINYCITNDTPPDIIYDVIKKYRDKLNITIDQAKEQKIEEPKSKKKTKISVKK